MGLERVSLFIDRRHVGLMNFACSDAIAQHFRQKMPCIYILFHGPVPILRVPKSAARI